MPYSTVGRNGRTTIPREVREALKLKPGSRLLYAIDAGHVTIRVHPGAAASKGALASSKGKGMTFAQIRAAAAKSAKLAWLRSRPRAPNGK